MEDPQLFAMLENVKYGDTVQFIMPIKYGKVVKVYDGDTITIAGYLPIPNSPLYRFSVRLNGIDTPEIKGKTRAEKDLALAAKNALSEFILEKVIELRNISNEKYGRILADVYLGGTHVNEWMIDNKYALRYSGGTKERPPEWDE
jgi:micrococcal nuclease